ncbi:hypothetical protein [Nevskia sp.]|uniref:hypothetical protein n=1 Tax=Nevskia sp. TaxID=1929292 RepID=UPI0025D6957F|nr:hypothetical protein [Nevskia sp.]
MTEPTARCPFDHTRDMELIDVKRTEEITKELLDRRYVVHGKKVLRAVHPKSHGCVDATFEVNDNIDPAYCFGLFAAKDQKKYKARIRYSNATALVGPDVSSSGNESRGMAIKIFDVASVVTGEVLEKDDGRSNQDFLLINQPQFAFANAHDYRKFNEIILGDGDDNPFAFFVAIAKDPGLTESERGSRSKTGELIEAIRKDVQKLNPLDFTYFGAAPFMLGPDKVMRFSVRPRFDFSGASSIDASTGPNRMRVSLAQAMDGNAVFEFDFFIQVRSITEDDLQLENASASWDEGKFEPVQVATITIVAPQADFGSAESLSNCEQLSFNPWHSLVAHQPVGSINRLRERVYPASAEYRRALNAK